MSQEQIMGLVRHVLTVAGGYFVAKGLADEGTVELAAGALATLLGVAWSIWSKRQTEN